MAVDLTKEIYKGTAGIELGGTIYTGAKGDAINKVAYAQLIYDDELKEYQASINRKVQASLNNATIIPVYDGYYTSSSEYSDASGSLAETVTPDEVRVSLADTSTVIYIKDGIKYTSWTNHDEYSPNPDKTFKLKGSSSLYINTGTYDLTEATNYFSKTFAMGTTSELEQGTGNAVTGFKSQGGTTYPLYGKTFAEKSDVDAVSKKVSDMLNGAPAAYDTLKEIADKLEANDDLHNAINASVNALQGLKVYLVTLTSNNAALITQANTDASKILIFFKAANNIVYPLTVRSCNSSTVITTPFVVADGATEADKNGTLVYLSITSSGCTQNGFYLDGYSIETSSISNTKLADKTITNAKIADGTIINAKISDSAIGTSKVADNAITEAKLSAEVQTKLNAVMEWEEL